MVTLTCAEAREVVFDYLDGELDAATARAVERHRDGCRNCPPLVTAIVAMLAQLRRIPEVSPGESFVAQLAAIPSRTP